MKSGYTFFTNPKNVPISKAIPGKEDQMVENVAGGYAFVAEDAVALRRWLLSGSESNLFYQDKDELTSGNVKILAKVVSVDPVLVAKEILYASDHGINNHTPILALVYLSMGNDVAKAKFKEIFNSVVRTASHLYEFLEYVKGLRGFGKLIHTAVENWIKSKNLKGLEYQFLKYQSRYNWSARDVLRKVKPIPRDAGENSLFAWIADKTTSFEELPLINVYETLKKGELKEAEVIKAILDFNLTHEMIPANVERTTGVWEALFQRMPAGATLRNLANLTNKGIFNSTANITVLEAKFAKEILEKARIHPISIVSAYRIYSGNGMFGRSKLTWKAIPAVEDILEVAIENAFEVLAPTGKTFYHALDVSGSMNAPVLETLWMTPMEIAGIMALATIKSEKYYFTSAFTDSAMDFPKLRKNTSFKSVLGRGFFPGVPNGTNLGSAIRYAIDNKIKADVLAFWTDGQTWAGNHPSLLMKEYRNAVNPDAKAVYVILTPYTDRTTLTDPKDARSYDIAGFSSESPKMVQMIANGEM